MKTIVRLLKLVWPYKKWIALSVFLGLLTVGSGIGLMMTSAFIISAAALHPSIAELQVAIVGVRFFGISRGVFRYLERLVSHDTTFRLLSRFRVWFYQKLEPLVPARTLYMKSADLLQRIIGDIQNLENFYVRVVAPPAVAVCVALLMLPLLGMFHLKYATIFLIFFAIAGTVIPAFSLQLSRGLGKRIVQLQSELNIAIVDNVKGLRELQVFNGTDKQQSKIDELNARINNLQKRMHIIDALNQGFITLLMFGAVIMVLMAAIPAVSHGHLKGVYLAVIVLGIMAAFEAVLPLPTAFQFMESNISAAQRLFGIIDSKPMVENIPGALDLTGETFAIELSDVVLRYPQSEAPALNRLNLNIPAGARVAIVGPSGSGKSSIANILLRLWEFQEGTITLNHKDIRSFTQESIREAIGFVSQRFHLFTGTIAENLRLVQPELSDEELLRMLDIVALQASDLGKTDRGEILSYWIGEHGTLLSGGQAQRLAIAQVLCKNPRVLLFDEITANLDPATERIVMDRLFETYRQRTIINITHRLNIMERYDQIFVLQNGKVVQQGRHEALLKQEGLYRHIYLVQTEQAMM